MAEVKRKKITKAQRAKAEARSKGERLKAGSFAEKLAKERAETTSKVKEVRRKITPEEAKRAERFKPRPPSERIQGLLDSKAKVDDYYAKTGRPSKDPYEAGKKRFFDAEGKRNAAETQPARVKPRITIKGKVEPAEPVRKGPKTVRDIVEAKRAEAKAKTPSLRTAVAKGKSKNEAKRVEASRTTPPAAALRADPSTAPKARPSTFAKAASVVRGSMGGRVGAVGAAVGVAALLEFALDRGTQKVKGDQGRAGAKASETRDKAKGYPQVPFSDPGINRSAVPNKNLPPPSQQRLSADSFTSVGASPQNSGTRGNLAPSAQRSSGRQIPINTAPQGPDAPVGGQMTKGGFYPTYAKGSQTASDFRTTYARAAVDAASGGPKQFPWQGRMYKV